MEKHEIAAILSDTRYFIQNSHGDRLYDIEWQYKQGFLGFLAKGNEIYLIYSRCTLFWFTNR